MNKYFFHTLVLLLLTACHTLTPMSKLDNVLHIIEINYVEDMNQTSLLNKSIPQVMNTLDSHSIYLTQKDLEKFLISTRGEFGGIGISLHIRNKLLTVITPINNTPAQLAGIQSEDVIIKINNTPILGLNIEQCIALTKGKVGTNLELTLLRKSESRPLHFSIKRRYINASPVFATLIDASLLYISIPTFNARTSKELKQVLQKYPNRKGIILDLRYNPGGILSQATSVVDMFIDKGVIVAQKGRLAKYSTKYFATQRNTDTLTPMVILINKGSASAAEIVSGTLQIYNRATVVGETSFGKGSVQTLFPLDNHSALKMTIAKYYLPNGKCIDNIGIKPNIIVTNTRVLKQKRNIVTYATAKKTLKKLSTGSIKPIYIKGKSRKLHSLRISSLKPSEIKRDNQLSKAIQILKNNN